MAFVESKQVSAAGRRKQQCNLNESDFVSWFGLGSAGRGFGSVGLGRWAKLGSLLAPAALSEFKPGLSFLLAESMAPKAKAKAKALVRAPAAKANAKAKAAPLPAAIAAIAAPPPPPPPPAAGVLNGWIGMACSSTHLSMVQGNNNTVSGLDLSIGALAEAFESGPLRFQGPEFGLYETPPAVVPGLAGIPPGKGLGKGLPRVGGRYRVMLNVDLQPAAGGAGMTVTALL